MRSLSALSLGSTVSVDKSKPKSDESKPKKHLSVRFDEQDNAIHLNDEVLSQEDLAMRWYLSDEMTTFKENNQRIVKKLIKGLDGTPSTFAKCMQKAYNGSTVKEVTRAMKDVFLDESIVGLEGWMLRPNQKDKRRAKILEAVKYWHEVSLSDESIRAEEMRAACRSHSKPSAYFAAHLADKANALLTA